MLTSRDRQATQWLIAQRIQAGLPWGFSRWGDGEWSAVLGLGQANCDGQAYEPLREPLRQVLRHRPAYGLGLQPLAVRKLGPQITGWLEAESLSPDWLYADVFHDLSKEWLLKDFIEPWCSRPIVMVGPAHLQVVSAVLPYRIFVEIPETNAFDALDSIRARLSTILPHCPAGTIVALSAGMSANLLIHEHAGRDKHIWMDFGSVWEPYVGRANRRYHADVLARGVA